MRAFLYQSSAGVRFNTLDIVRDKSLLNWKYNTRYKLLEWNLNHNCMVHSVEFLSYYYLNKDITFISFCVNTIIAKLLTIPNLTNKKFSLSFVQKTVIPRQFSWLPIAQFHLCLIFTFLRTCEEYVLKTRKGGNLKVFI